MGRRSPRLSAVLVGAGRGERLGREKLFVSIAGRPAISLAVEAFEAADFVDEIVLVVRSEHLPRVRAMVGENGWRKVAAVVPGGERRQDSVLAGLAAAGAAEFVAIHDLARPLVTPELIGRVFAAAREGGAAVPGLPVRDTLKLVEDGVVVRTVPRAGLWATQTPQIFRADLLKAAIDPGLEVTDEAAWLEARGVPVRIVLGDPANIKLTYPEDLEIAEALVKYRFEVGWCSGSG